MCRIIGEKKLTNFDRMKAGNIVDAMITAMGLVQIGPGWIPRPIMRLVANLMIRSQKKSPEEVLRDGNTTMKELAPVLRYDFAVVEEVVADSTRFSSVGENREILLLDGGNSPAYAKIATDRLEQVIKGAQRVGIIFESIRLSGITDSHAFPPPTCCKETC